MQFASRTERIAPFYVMEMAKTAQALAHAHDDGARPALIAMLAVAALRVDAALALEVLAPGLDPVPLLAPLVAALDSPRDTDQLTACEAIVVLTAPASAVPAEVP